MAGASQSMSLSGLAEWLDATGRTFERADFGEPLAICAQIGKQSVLDNFANCCAPDGTPWAPLKRPRKDGSDIPLQDTGIMRAASTGGAGYSEEITETELVTSNNLDRALWHQEGTKTIPARPFMGWRADDVEKCQDVFGEWMQRQVE